MRCFGYFVVTAMIFGATLMSCNKNDDNIYPTTINRLSEEALSRKRNDFAQKNPYVSSTLNRFGFCAQGEPRNVAVYPTGSFTEEEAIASVREFVARNPEYTGGSNPNNLSFRTIERDALTNDWSFSTINQMMNDIEIEYTCIIFRTKSRAVSFCDGNHFPNVYVPKKFNFDTEQAKSQLLGKKVLFSGGPAIIITEEHLQQSTAKLIIVPITTDEKIELRVAWQIKIETLHTSTEVDVMTGEIMVGDII